MSEPDGKTGPTEDYALGHSERELERLGTQALVIDPITRRFFGEAGIGPGMRVLDVGSGAGHVALLVAGLVGDQGEVVGVDRSPSALARARERAHAQSIHNVSFLEGDPANMAFDRPFDAITGRYVLMFQPDPTTMLRKLASHVRPGGPVVFHEVDWDGARSVPPAPSYDQCCRWLVDTLRLLGAEPRLGLKLHAMFVAAGLPPPTMRIDALIGGGVNGTGPTDMMADLIETVSSDMERLGVATADQVGFKTLAQRLRDEAIANNSVIMGRYEIGAWSRV